jgi:hypothetical protein
VKVFIKATLAAFLCLVWASLDNAYAGNQPAKLSDKHLESKNETASKPFKDVKSAPVGRDEPAVRVTEPPDKAPAK